MSSIFRQVFFILGCLLLLVHLYCLAISRNGPSQLKPHTKMAPRTSTHSEAEHSCVCGAGFNLAHNYSRHKTTCEVVEQEARRAFAKGQLNIHKKPRKRKRTESRGSAASGSRSSRRRSSSSSGAQIPMDIQQETDSEQEMRTDSEMHTNMDPDIAGDIGFEVCGSAFNLLYYSILTKG